MTNPLLSNFELAGQQIDIRDSASYDLATAAQQAAEGIIEGFNTQFAQIPSEGNLISPYYCKRNNTVYFEFPNIPFLGTVEANTWVSVFTLPKGYRPLSTCYRVLFVDGISSMIIELSSSGKVKVYPEQKFTTSSKIFGGFSYLTI